MPALGLQALQGLGFQCGQLGARLHGGVCQRLQGLAQLDGLGAFAGAQVAVARTQGQAIVGAAGGPGNDLNGQGKLLHHLADHHELLVVLAAKHGHARASVEHAGKQLHHHRTHPGEKAGAKVPFQNVCQLRVGLHLEGLRLGIQVFFAGGKQNVAACSAQLVGVLRQGARVAVEVFVGQKLQAVHEDAGHQRIAQGFGLLHQGQMPFVQVAHGGNKSRAAASGQRRAQVCQGVNDVHGMGQSGGVLTRRARRCRGSCRLSLPAHRLAWRP